MKPYRENFYKERHYSTEYAANKVLSLVLETIPIISSAIDLGCGVGTWLSILKQKGIHDIQGVDGEWVNKEFLVIPTDKFLPNNMTDRFDLDRKFDLAITLEVAEHIPQEKAEDFVESLTKLSDYVLFSAAIPYQGGRNHINEQWPDYWNRLFRKRNFVCIDIIRKRIWNDDKIPYYYRQNILLFVAKEKTESLNITDLTPDTQPLALIHPEIYLDKLQKHRSLKGALKLLRKAIKNIFKNASKLKQ